MSMHLPVGLAGDWHGNVLWAVHCLEKFREAGVRDILQVGDFGYWPGYKGALYLREISKALEENDQYLIVVPGNHENWGGLKAHWDDYPDTVMSPASRIEILPRGKTFLMGDKWFYTFGGAPSIDFQFRTEGVDWWIDELPTVEERERLLDKARDHVRREGTVDVFLAHDVPNIDPHFLAGPLATILTSNPMGWPSVALKYAEFGREILTPFYEVTKPKLWVNGHYHAHGVRHNDGNEHADWLSLHMDGQQGNCYLLDINGEISLSSATLLDLS